jgi:hypothetical protein
VRVASDEWGLQRQSLLEQTKQSRIDEIHRKQPAWEVDTPSKMKGEAGQFV